MLFAACAMLLLADALAEPRCAHDCGEHGICASGECECYPGYVGADCSRSCKNNCTQRGICVDGSGGAACDCANGFTGVDCSSAICPNDCSGHGKCDGLICKCADGWSGHDCSIRTCVDDCSHHGHCFNGTCYCMPGYGTGLPNTTCAEGAPPHPPPLSAARPTPGHSPRRRPDPAHAFCRFVPE